MTGPEHYREAEIYARSGCTFDPPCEEDGCQHEMATLARGQLHATLALAAATALPRNSEGWFQAAGGAS